MILATEEEYNAVRPRCRFIVTFGEYLFYCVREECHEGEHHYIKYKRDNEKKLDK